MHSSEHRNIGTETRITFGAISCWVITKKVGYHIKLKVGSIFKGHSKMLSSSGRILGRKFKVGYIFKLSSIGLCQMWELVANSLVKYIWSSPMVHPVHSRIPPF